ncbi:MAG: hypothetical protein MUC96_15405 [Myxococcaceae bacterium]|jgi:transposase-like protein|nr:hypothetical protein [Myxococcaceae bacterium]
MSMHRTTLMLDAPSRAASKRLAQKLGVSPSEVMRRALQLLQAEVLGVPEEDRKRRVAAFEKLVELSSKLDAAKELKRLKRERAEW